MGVGLIHRDTTVAIVEAQTATDPQRRARAYVDAWIKAVTDDGTYQAGVYCPLPFGSRLRAAHPKLPIWAVNDQPGLAPVDQDHDLNPIDFTAQTAPFTLWQYRLDASGGNADLRFLDDYGTLVRWNDPTKPAPPGIDFDLSHRLDPSQPNTPLRKTPRTVAALTLDATSVIGGEPTQAVITLDRAAPEPGGTIVVLRASSPEAQIRATARVAPGQTSVPLPVSTAPVRTPVTVDVVARALHQLDTEPQRATVTVNPSQQ